MIIRNLCKADYPLIDACMQELHALHVQGRPDLYGPLEHPYSEEEFAEIVECGRYIAIAAVDEAGDMAGFCIAQIKNKSLMIAGVKVAYIDDMFVRREYRRRGVASFLYEEVKARAKAAGAVRVDLMVWNFNESALELYKSLGMTPQRYIMEQKL